jgi:hypothetical protein
MEYPMDLFSPPIPATAHLDRVISLVPAITATLYDLNLADRLVAVSHACHMTVASARSLPVVARGDQVALYRPGLVIAAQDSVLLPDLVDMGYPVWSPEPRNLPENFNLLWYLMSAFDEPTMSPRVRLIEQTCDWLQASHAGAARSRPRVGVALADPEPRVVAPGPYLRDLVETCGGVVYETEASGAMVYGAQSQEPDQAEARESSPDLILLARWDDADEGAAYIAAWGPVPVVPIDARWLFWFGTAAAYALEYLPPILADGSDTGTAI